MKIRQCFGSRSRTGNLTSAILKKPNKLIVVEKDNQLADQLRLKFEKN